MQLVVAGSANTETLGTMDTAGKYRAEHFFENVEWTDREIDEILEELRLRAFDFVTHELKRPPEDKGGQVRLPREPDRNDVKNCENGE
jgi:hypothetical protein